MKYNILKTMLLLSGIMFSNLSFAGNSTTLNDAFVVDNLDATTSYFEYNFGPAWKIEGTDRIYKFGKCKMTAGTSKGNIVSMETDLSEQCPITLSSFGIREDTPYYNLRFKNFIDKYTNHFTASCLYSCGNSYTPYVSLLIDGPHANDYIGFILSSSMDREPTLSASSNWETFMEDREGKDYIFSRRFNCDTKYDKLAGSLFANSLITHIKIARFIKQENSCDDK